MGSSTIEEMNAPMASFILPSLASLTPLVSTTQYPTKSRVEMMTGVPRPPLRMMAPRGAPMKKNSRQASDRENFLNISTNIFLVGLRKRNESLS